jgi:photosystem II stability/assembly factor-like uncharacterized protein
VTARRLPAPLDAVGPIGFPLRFPPSRRRSCASRAGRAAASLFALLVLPPAAVRADWVVLPRYTTQHLNSLAFVDNLRGWVGADGGSILVTTDGGATWDRQTTPVSHDIVDVNMLDAQNGWALAQQIPTDSTTAYGTTVLRTTDGGAEWFEQATFDDLLLHAVEFTDTARGCAGGDLGKIFVSTNGGKDWTQAVVDSPLFAQWPVRDFTFLTPLFGMASGGFYDVTGIVWRTTDGGDHWTYDAAAGEPIFGTHFFDPQNLIGVTGDLDFGSGMVRSTDGGVSWDYTYLGIWGQASAIAFRTATEAWAPLGFAGTYMVTTDAGQTWTASFTPDSSAMVDAVFTDSETGYMVGEGGTVLRYTNPLTSVGSVAGDARALAATLCESQPNPFRKTTRLAFRVARAGPVSMSVLDASGRVVATLADEWLAAGDHARTLDGASLPSGVYYVRLSAAGRVETTKTVLVR